MSSSRNARPVLEAAGLAPRFAVVVDGVVAAQEHLNGKPAPDLFCTPPGSSASTRSGRSMEDAVSGVAAGRAGLFGLVVGVDRGAGEEALREHGADLVVSDLGELVEASQ